MVDDLQIEGETPVAEIVEVVFHAFAMEESPRHPLTWAHPVFQP